MISRSTLIGALVVVELAILGLAARAIGLSGSGAPSFAAGGPPWGGEVTTQVDRSYPTGPAPVVVVDIHDINVSITTAPISSVRVVDGSHNWGFISHGRPASVTVDRTPDGLRVAVNDSSHAFFSRIGRHLRLTVPLLAQVRVVSAADVDASGLRTAFIAHDVNDVTVNDHHGDLDVSAVRGDIELADVQANTIAAATSKGDITFKRVVSGQLNAHSDDGDISADGMRASDGAVSTADGDVQVSFAPGTDATVKLTTGDGHISVNGTESDGDGSHAKTVQFGFGRGHLDISSGDGNITTQGATV